MLMKELNRTPYTNQPIPEDDVLNKFWNNKIKREGYQPFNPEGWIKNETRHREELKHAASCEIGVALAQLEGATNALNNALKKQAHQDFMLSIIKKYEEDRDYIGFLAEERYGKYTVPKEVKEYLNEDIIVSYVASKYGLVRAAQIKRLLEDE